MGWNGHEFYGVVRLLGLEDIFVGDEGMLDGLWWWLR
jgi:hypothetical protein